MKIVPVLLLVTLSIAGCQSETPAANPESETSSSSSPTTTESSNTAKDAETTGTAGSSDQKSVSPGMNMADVKKIKGAPKDTKHEHGPNNSEIDLWIYEDQTVKFEDGKVVE